MDINNIKQPAGLGPLSDLPEETASKPARGSTFSDAASRLQETESTSSPQALSHCDKASLEVPEKLDAMVRQCISELVESGQQTTGPLSKADKQTLTDFLSQDPLIRRQVESYLRKVAT